MKTCQHPDRDVPEITCGYPLPCPYHTVEIELGSKAAMATFPPEATAAIEHQEKVQSIVRALVGPTRKYSTPGVVTFKRLED